MAVRFHEVVAALGEPTRRLVDADGVDECMWQTPAGTVGILDEDEGLGWWAVEYRGDGANGRRVDGAALETMRRVLRGQGLYDAPKPDVLLSSTPVRR